MSEPNLQTYANHGRLDPWYHFFLAPIALIILIASIVHVAMHFHPWGLLHVVLAFAFLVLVTKLRSYPLKVQDRVIRLEERMRLERLCGEQMRSRITQLTTRQIVGLRFASDAEVCALATRALDENLTEKQIKQAIANWRADYCRV